MTFLRLTRTEWAAVGVLIMAAWYGTQWLAGRDARVRNETALERKVDALFTWADLVSQLEGWPRPRIPERPVALPHPRRLDPDGGPYAAQLDEQNQGGCR